jgi:hypothetical protein
MARVGLVALTAAGVLAAGPLAAWLVLLGDTAEPVSLAGR